MSDEEHKALRYNEGKLQWHLVDWNSLEPMVRGLMYGADKYAPDNWKEGLPLDEVCDSLLRHLFSIMRGELIDQESGLPHIGLVMCNAMFLSYELARGDGDTN